MGPEVQNSSECKLRHLTHGLRVTDDLLSIQFLEKPTAWAINTVRPLPTYVKGKVALIGDAVRPFTSCSVYPF